jgi:hypothetical protein
VKLSVAKLPVLSRNNTILFLLGTSMMEVVAVVETDVVVVVVLIIQFQNVHTE